MRTYVLDHLSDALLLHDLQALVVRERAATAAVVAHLAEVDARRLYLPAGFPSMYEYCLGKLRMSEQAAMKRIRAGRAGRRFPAILDALAEGRLHLSAVVLLAPHLTPDNADELMAAAAYQTKADIEQLLARRFPKADVPALIQPMGPLPGPSAAAQSLSLGTVEPVAGQLAPAPIGTHASAHITESSCQLSPGTVDAFALAGELSPAQVEGPVPRPKVTPLSPGRFALRFTIGQETHDTLRYAQALLSHRLPSGDLAQVFDRALEALVRQLERQKLGATSRPQRRSRRSSANPRCIPARVKRAVWERDRGRCTFVGAAGQRCPARRFLEFDHVNPVARGGQATVEGVRLRCAGHNQYEAEQTFGAGFMAEKREAARCAAAEARARARQGEQQRRARAAGAEARSRAAAEEQAREVTTCLRQLGFRAGEARRAVEYCATRPDTTLEARVRAALRFLCPRPRSHNRDGTSLEART
jgi:hypothetical protein